MTATISTTFDDGLDGWGGAPHSFNFHWEKSGGDPGGYGSFTGNTHYKRTGFSAPQQYDGDLRSYKGGTFSFDAILHNKNDYTVVFETQRAGNVMLTDLHTSHTVDGWKDYSFKLDAAAFGLSPSDFQHALHYVIDIYIQITNQSDKHGGFDNIDLTPRQTSASSIDHSAFEHHLQLQAAFHPADLLDHAHLAIA